MKPSISLIISAKDDVLPQTHPKQLKNELITNVLSHKYIDSVFITRRGQIIFTTKSTQSAQEILNIKNLLMALIQAETITSRFLIRIDRLVSCIENATDLIEKGLNVYEVHRFSRKSLSGL